MNGKQENYSFHDFSTPASKYLRKTLKSGGKKKTVLVVEDNELNREMLDVMLRDEFELLMAENGEVAIELLKLYREKLSAVLLDVYMPVCDGFEFLERTQEDPYLSAVPVIVATGSDKHEDEEKCIQLGATDFVTKPYNSEVLLGRLHNVIGLRESLSELSIVERDYLTGLYNISAFCHHGEQIMADEKIACDLRVVHIQNFYELTSIYGSEASDETLKYIADDLRRRFRDALIARENAFFYILTNAANRVDDNSFIEEYDSIPLFIRVEHARVRMGVYLDVDKTKSMHNLCDRVRMAINYDESITAGKVAYYDAEFEARRLRDHALLNAFDDAIINNEYVVWLQPKVEVATGNIVGAEALVRWITPDGNYIPPVEFVPLYERHGIIAKLDEYVFRSVCKYQHERSVRGEADLLISVNVSRGSLFGTSVPEKYKQIAEEEQVKPGLIAIEITETAAIDEMQVRDLCNRFIEAGFSLWMDDFGTGYSSLHSISVLPFSGIKLDKRLVDQLNTNKGKLVVKSVIDGIHDIGMEIVAEGVETTEQLEILSSLECDGIQGYLYSEPVMIDDFEKLAKANPFCRMNSELTRKGQGVTCVSASDLRKYFKVCKSLFSIVRILDTDCLGYSMVGDDGNLESHEKNCFNIWNREERCSNCITLKALESRTTQRKQEVLDGQTYEVYSTCIIVDGEPRMIELLNIVD